MAASVHNQKHEAARDREGKKKKTSNQLRGGNGPKEEDSSKADESDKTRGGEGERDTILGRKSNPSTLRGVNKDGSSSSLKKEGREEGGKESKENDGEEENIHAPLSSSSSALLSSVDGLDMDGNNLSLFEYDMDSPVNSPLRFTVDSRAENEIPRIIHQSWKNRDVGTLPDTFQRCR